MKKHVYRYNDAIRIMQPTVVTRVGYAFDLKAEAARIGREYNADICALLDKLLPEQAPAAPALDWPAYVALTHKLAYIVGAHRGMGGRTRRLWTEEQPDIVNHVWRIEAKRTAMTGEYYMPSSYRSYEGEYDYTPGGLSGARCHLLLTCYRADWLGEGTIEVEAANVCPAEDALEPR